MAAEDSESWFESALRHAELAAHQIARFRNPWWNPTWRDLAVPDDPPPACGAFAVAWGLRGKRSRPAASPAVARFVKGDSAAACCPATPFDFGSGSGASSTSGGEEGSSSPEKAAAARGKRRRVGDGGDVSAAGSGCETKVVGIQRAPFGFTISAAKDINKRTGKKKTLSELQVEEKLLMEEKQQLEKEIELKVEAYDKLWLENQILKSRQVVNAAERVHKAADACVSSSAVPSSSACFSLPDLNEPPSEKSELTEKDEYKVPVF